MDAGRVHVVAAVIRDGAGRVLLARRPPGGPHAGLWEFPGGKVEPGETPEAALAREILEELGVVVAVGARVAAVDHDYSHLSIRLCAYRCRVVRGEPRGADGQPVAWVRPRDLPAWPLPEADVPVAVRLAREATP